MSVWSPRKFPEKILKNMNTENEWTTDGSIWSDTPPTESKWYWVKHKKLRSRLVAYCTVNGDWMVNGNEINPDWYVYGPPVKSPEESMMVESVVRNGWIG
jgi:hypothetical protein